MQRRERKSKKNINKFKAVINLPSIPTLKEKATYRSTSYERLLARSHLRIARLVPFEYLSEKKKIRMKIRTRIIVKSRSKKKR